MTDNTNDTEAIRKVRQEHLEASMAHDLDTIVATFAEDGVELSPGLPPVIGRDAYREHCQGMLEQAGEFGFSFDQAELVVNTAWAFEWGTYSMTVSRLESSVSHSTKRNLW
jgi:uncharacterized protein (TIGR02246 family)